MTKITYEEWTKENPIDLDNYDDDEEYIPRNREKAKTASYGFFWCDVCDYYYGGELGKCPECGTKGNYKKIKYDRNRNSFNA